MTDLITVFIDDQPIEVAPGTLVVDAAKRMGNDIPVFCYHPKMDPVGMCRMCLVEIGRPQIDRATGEQAVDDNGQPVINFGQKLETSCTVPVSPGMHVLTNTEVVIAARKEVLEFLLTSHPLDCPICDKGGECPLQNLTIAHGPGTSRFIFEDKMRLEKHVPLGELIYLDRERCIQCARCTRFSDELADDNVIGFYERGRHLEIVTFSDPGFDSYWSGNTTDICPVGALTTADFRFNARPWELKHTASICTHCPVGCNTDINYRRDGLSGRFEVKRILPRQNEQVNEIWMCDKGRFGYHYTTSLDRLTTPLIRKNGELQPASWDEALTLVADKLKAANGNIVGLLSERLSNEDLFTGRGLVEGLGGKVAQAVGRMGGGELVQQVGVGVGTDLGQIGSGTTVVVVASDLEEEGPVYWLRIKQAATRRNVKLVVANGRPTKTDRAASSSIRYAYGEEVATVQSLRNHDDIKNAENLIVVYGSDGLDYAGTSALAQACANLLIETNHFGRTNNGLLAVWPNNNTQGAWDMGVHPAGTSLTEFTQGAQVVILADADPVSNGQQLPDGAFVVAVEMFATPTARNADVILPTQSYMEYEGSFTNGERRVQRFYPALPPFGQSRPTWQIFSQIATHLDAIEKPRASGSGVFIDIAKTIPSYAGLTYQALAQVVPQWPDVGTGDLYYGGTSHKNTGGLGVQTPTTSEQGQTVNASAVPVGNAATADKNQLRAISTTLLYNRDPILLRSQVLHPRIPTPYIAFNDSDAAALGIADGDLVTVDLDQHTTALTARVGKHAPQGVVLVPQHLGVLNFRGSQVLQVRKVEAQPA